MLLFDPRGKATECDLAIDLVADPERRIVLESLRSVWLALHNTFSLADDRDSADQFSIIAQIHTELMAGCRMAMH